MFHSKQQQVIKQVRLQRGSEVENRIDRINQRRFVDMIEIDHKGSTPAMMEIAALPVAITR